MASPKTASPIVVIGAGIGGLTTAALLCHAGHPVTVLEAHVYPGGCAGTFYHQGYRFDAGATLAGGFAPGGPHARLAAQLGLTWPVHPVSPAWVTHLPHASITQWAEPERWQAERARVFPGTERFWQQQEMLAALAWDVSAQPFPWPPTSVREALVLARALHPGMVRALPALTTTLAHFIPANVPQLKVFLDAQLLIAAQTTATYTNALYGCAALDLPRRGVNHVAGGIGSLAKTLLDWLKAHGAQVLMRQTVEKLEVNNGRVCAAHTDKGLRVVGDVFVANTTPWALRNLLGANAPTPLQRETQTRSATWGAFTLYLGLEKSLLPPLTSDHHQVVVDPTRPLGEGNSVFISLAATADEKRAPADMRAATLSTHTAIAPWWAALRQSETAYQDRKAQYTEQLLTAAERALPGLRRAVRLCLPGTPLTFEYYTRRPLGMVGGFAQTSLLTARGPRTGLPNLWLVGDSIFPGQSTAATTLGGMRVAEAIMRG